MHTSPQCLPCQIKVTLITHGNIVHAEHSAHWIFDDCIAVFTDQRHFHAPTHIKTRDVKSIDWMCLVSEADYVQYGVISQVFIGSVSWQQPVQSFPLDVFCNLN